MKFIIVTYRMLAAFNKIACRDEISVLSHEGVGVGKSGMDPSTSSGPSSSQILKEESVCWFMTHHTDDEGHPKLPGWQGYGRNVNATTMYRRSEKPCPTLQGR